MKNSCWQRTAQVCCFTPKLGLHEAGVPESESLKTSPSSGFVLKPKRTKAAFHSRKHTLLSLSSRNINFLVSSLRLFSAALQMRRSATNAACVRLGINRESRFCNPNCRQAFAPACLTVCVNSPRRTQVCWRFVAFVTGLYRILLPQEATHTSGFERNFSVSNC